MATSAKQLNDLIFTGNECEDCWCGMCKMGNFNIYMDEYFDEPEIYYVNIWANKEHILSADGNSQFVYEQIKNILNEHSILH